MGEIIMLLIIAGLVIGWILAGRNYYKEGVMRHFFGHVGCCVALVVIYWGLIIYPVLHCSGFLCGLGEALLFSGLSAGTILVWGLILLVYSGKNFSQNKKKIHTEKHDTVDHSPLEDEEF